MPESKDKKAIVALPPKAWEKIEAAIHTINHGSITIVVQDAKVIQIEINEKIKLI